MRIWKTDREREAAGGGHWELQEESLGAAGGGHWELQEEDTGSCRRRQLQEEDWELQEEDTGSCRRRVTGSCRRRSLGAAEEVTGSCRRRSLGAAGELGAAGHWEVLISEELLDSSLFGSIVDNWISSMRSMTH
ncbi:hypothetical protein WMY93_015306 [Mugilogobius chulae]|uniref:Uncharacterized protein n=1 Tax=Mugilogobius chulae TaxID=88201 RepID=A0AAW0NPN0_9GOBI